MEIQLHATSIYAPEKRGWSVYAKWQKNARPNLQKANLHYNTKNTGLLVHGFRFTSFCRSNKCSVSILSFNAGRCTSEQRLSGSLANSRCRTNHLKLILCSPLQVLDITDFSNIDGRFLMPQINAYVILIGGTSRPCYWSSPSYQLFPKLVDDNFRTARNKRGGAPSCTNHKWILICRFTSSNSCGRTFRTKSW